MPPSTVVIVTAIRRDDEAAGDRLAERAIVVQALKRDTHEYIAAAFQTSQALSCGEVGRFQRVRTDEALHLVELLIVGPLDQHASGPVAAAPHDDRAIVRIAEVQALQRLRALIIRCDDRRRTRLGPSGQNDPCGRDHAGFQESTTR